MLENRESVLLLLLWTAFLRKSETLRLSWSDLQRDDFDARAFLVSAGYLDEERLEQLESLERSMLSVHQGNVSAAIAALGGAERLRPLLKGPDTAGLVSDDTAPMEVLHPRFGAPEIPFDIPDLSARYTHVSEHASGGMGRVLIVHDKQLGRDIALKELLPESEFDGNPSDSPVRRSTAMAYRFIQEGMLTAKLEHPSIVPVYELGVRKDGTPYYTMKLVRGKTLATEIKACTTTKQRLRLLSNFVAICQAIAYAHGRGVIHRDIKPTNIMIGDFGETVVLDWGIAKLKRNTEPDAVDTMALFKEKLVQEFGATALTELGQTVGTPGYMSPEQAMGRVDLIDESSDIFSLGVVLYEVLSGKRAFSSSSVAALIDQTIRGNPTPLKEVAPDLPAELISICNRAMEKDPRRRYPSVKSLIADIVAFQSGALVSSHEYTWREFLSRQYAKNQSRIHAAIAATLVLIAVGAYAYLSIWRARNFEREQRQRAEVAEAQAQVNLKTAEEARADAEFERDLANTRLLRQRIAASDFTRAEQLLTENPPAGAPWEWRQAAYTTSREYARFGIPGAGIFSIEMDNTRTRMLTLHQDHRARVWEIPSGALLFEAPAAVERLTWGALSPDASTIVTTDGAGLATVYSLTEKKQLAQLDLRHEFCNAVAYLSPDELVVGADDGRVRLWKWKQPEDAAVIARLAGPIATLQVHRPTRRIAVSTSEWQTALITEAGPAEPQTFPGRPGGFTPDGELFASTSLGDLFVRDAATGEVSWTSGSEAGEVVRVDANYPGRLVTISAGGTVRLYDIDKREVSFIWRGTTQIRDAKLAEGGQILLATDMGSNLNWINVADGRLLDTCGGQYAGGTGLATYTGIEAITYGGDGAVKFWRPDTALLGLGQWLSGQPEFGVLRMAASSESKLIALTTAAGALVVADAENGSILAEHVAPTYGLPRAVAMSGDGALLAFSADGYSAALAQTSTPDTPILLPDSAGLIRSLALSHDHSRAAVATNHGVIDLWDTSTRQRIISLNCGDTAISALEFIDGAEKLVAATEGGRLYRIAGAPPAVDTEVELDAPIASITYSPRTGWLAVGFVNGNVQLHDADSLAKLTTTQVATGEVDSLAFDATGKRLFTSGAGATRVWLVKEDATLHDVGIVLDWSFALAISGPNDDFWRVDSKGDLQVMRTAVPVSTAPAAVSVPVAALTTPKEQQRAAIRLKQSAPDWLQQPFPLTIPTGPDNAVLQRWGMRAGDEIASIDASRGGALANLGQLVDLLAAGDNQGAPVVWEARRQGIPLRGRMLAFPPAQIAHAVSLGKEDCATFRTLILGAIDADGPQIRAFSYQQGAAWFGCPPTGDLAAVWLPDVSRSPLKPWMPRLMLSVNDRVVRMQGQPVTTPDDLRKGFEPLCQSPDPVKINVERGAFVEVEITMKE